MAEWLQWLESHYRLSPELQANLFYTFGVILLLALVRAIILRLVSTRTQDVRTLYRWQKAITYISYGVVVLILADIWLNGINNLVAYFGLLSAGLAIALKDPVVNFFGWIFILWRQPFVVGDRIQIGTNAGDVIDVRIFQFSVLEIGGWVQADQSTGRVLHIPNGRVFTETLANYTGGFPYIWNEVRVRLTFESDWEKAKARLQQIVSAHNDQINPDLEKKVKQAGKKYIIQYGVLTPTVYTSVDDYGVVLTMRYLCPPLRRRTSQQALWESVLRLVGTEPDISLAYPTQRINYQPDAPGRSKPAPGANLNEE